MIHETALNPKILVLHQNTNLAAEIEMFCQAIFAAVENLSTDYYLADARKVASSEQNPSDFDVVVLWLTSDFIGEDSVIDWIEDWADRRSGKAGGSIYCLTGAAPTLSLRFWKVFVESVGAKPGIDFHWRRIKGDDQESKIAAELNRWRDFYGETEDESEQSEFKLQNLA